VDRTASKIYLGTRPSHDPSAAIASVPLGPRDRRARRGHGLLGRHSRLVRLLPVYGKRGQRPLLRRLRVGRRVHRLFLGL
jgi:hypothetical protein